jgi:hypothetical protein
MQCAVQVEESKDVKPIQVEESKDVIHVKPIQEEESEA